MARPLFFQVTIYIARPAGATAMVQSLMAQASAGERAVLVSPDRLWLLCTDLRNPLGQQLLQSLKCLREALNTFLQLVVGHTIGSVHLVEGCLVNVQFLDLN